MDEGFEYLRESPSFAYNTFMPQYQSRGYQYNQQPRPQPQYNAQFNGKLYCTKAQKDHLRFKIRNSRFNI